jgi:DNA polymerase III delta prime subunit
VGSEPVVDFGFRGREPAPQPPQVSPLLRQRIERWKQQLLDVSRRNRGINYRPARNTLALPLGPEELWQALLAEESALELTARQFAPDAPNPADDDRARAAFDAARRLLDRAREADREQGIRVLFLALGWLDWVDADGHRLRSPLILVPVDLDIDRAARVIRLAPADDDAPEVNPSLAYVLRAQFGIRLPAFENEDGEPLFDGLEAYLAAVRAAIAAQDGWSAEADGPAVDVFAFAKLAMVEELERSAARLAASPVIARLTGELPPDGGEPPAAEPAAPRPPVDERIPPGSLHIVIDADAYQLEAVAMAAAGQSFVIEGPPGTGKSQVITNIAAELLAAGKTVLFVAEKRVAREVVLENLQKAGLGEACLHLAINAGAGARADTKAAVIREIIETLDAGPPPAPPPADLPARVAEVRQRLNAHAAAMARPLGDGGWTTLYDLIGFAEASRADRRQLAGIPPLETCSRYWLDDVAAEFARLDRLPGGALEALAGPWSAFRGPGAADPAAFGAALERIAAAPAAAAAALEGALAPGAPDPAARTPADLAAAAAHLEAFPALQRRAASPLRFLAPGYYRARSAAGAARRAGFQPVPDAAERAARLRSLAGQYAAEVSLLAPAFGSEHPLGGPIAHAAEWAAALLPGLDHWHALAEAADALAELERLGMRAPAVALLRDPSARRRLEAAARASILAAWAEAAIAAAQPLTPSQHERLTESLARLEQELIGAARADALARLRARRRSLAPRTPAMQQLAKYHRAKRRPALRTMLGTTREAVQLLKPCLLMSPLAAAQYLCHGDESRTYRFDCVILDEASMVPTADMAVALSLAPQAIIVGDSKQMPPTSFFSRDLGENGALEEDEVTFESVLDEAAPALPSTMLQAHYRSRDETLIAFSNVHFYDGRLVAYPDAWGSRPESGVRFEYVADAAYGRGATRANPAEAARCLALLRQELEASGFKRQVSITAMSIAQQQEILRQAEEAALADPVIRRWLDEGGTVRNLETVQGDESDVMILSVGYGRDADGRLIMNFGPIGQEKGERRLNVAITRARWKTIVVSSLRAADIDPARATSTGALRLRDYLDYAERGLPALQASGRFTPRQPGPFEQALRAALEARGLRVVPAVGAGGYTVDLALAHPGDPERYVLGIECDGPGYRAVPACRDREVGNPAVLRRMGWNLHRVLAAAWYRDPEAELARILERYEAALRG